MAICDIPRYDDVIRQHNFLFEDTKTIEEFKVFDITRYNNILKRYIINSVRMQF